MLTNKTHSSLCECTAEMISYLYDEASAMERDRFESHLLECVDCSDEFAELSNSRFSVFEWHKLEFLPLPTPNFSVPFEKPVIAVQSGRREGIYSAISSLLAFNWRLAAAVGGLIVFVGLGLVIGSRYLGRDSVQSIHETAGDSDSAPAPLTGVPAARTSDQRADVVTSDETPVDIRPLSPQPLKISVNTRRIRPANASRGNAQRLTIFQAASRPNSRDRRVPTLNSDGDDDDRSLRLTDLFDSIGSRR